MKELNPELEDPIEMFVEMAKKGEIDPWNIDVIDVAAKFLEKLERAQKLDLRISGRVLLYAAILIRMKAEILSAEAVRVKKEPEIIPDEVNFEEFYQESFEPDSYLMELDEGLDKSEYKPETEEDLIQSLMKVQRKTVRRFTTLQDLIRELQMAETVEKRRKKRRKKIDEQEAIKETLETPHEENIEEILVKVENELLKLFRRKNLLYFSEIIKGKEKEKLSYYLSVLHLAYRKILEVNQKRIFEEDIELKLYKSEKS